MKRFNSGTLCACALAISLMACADGATTPLAPTAKAGMRPSFAIIVTPALDSITPHTATVASGATQQYSAWDVNNAAMAGSAVTWSVSGGGTIDANGLFTAGTTAGTFTVSAFDPNFNYTTTASITVTVASTKCDDDKKSCDDDHGDKGHGDKGHGDDGHAGKGGKGGDQGHGGGGASGGRGGDDDHDKDGPKGRNNNN